MSPNLSGSASHLQEGKRQLATDKARELYSDHFDWLAQGESR